MASSSRRLRPLPSRHCAPSGPFEPVPPGFDSHRPAWAGSASRSRWTGSAGAVAGAVASSMTSTAAAVGEAPPHGRFRGGGQGFPFGGVPARILPAVRTGSLPRRPPGGDNVTNEPPRPFNAPDDSAASAGAAEGFHEPFEQGNARYGGGLAGGLVCLCAGRRNLPAGWFFSCCFYFRWRERRPHPHASRTGDESTYPVDSIPNPGRSITVQRSLSIPPWRQQ